MRIKGKHNHTDDVAQPDRLISDNSTELQHPTWLPLLVAAVLIAVTGVVYRGMHQHDFIYLDDPKYVTSNEHIKKGLTLEGIKWAMTDMAADYWRPVTSISHICLTSVFLACGHAVIIWSACCFT